MWAIEGLFFQGEAQIDSTLYWEAKQTTITFTTITSRSNDIWDVAHADL